MLVDQALRLTSVLQASSSFIALTLGASLPGWLTVMTGGTLILALLRNMRSTALTRLTTQMSFSTTGWNVLMITSFVGFLVDLLWISGGLFPAGVHFLMILMIVKLCTLQHRRDYLHLYAISLVAILASGSLTTELWYLPIFIGYLMAGVWTLLLFQLLKTAGKSHHGHPSLESQDLRHESGRRVTPQLFWLANGLALTAFGLTVIIFFAIPRVSAGIYQKGIGQNIRTSGFSDTVNLGAIGPIKRDPSVVMRIELPDQPRPDGSPFYVRGVAFDRYDGRSWTNQLNYRRTVHEGLEDTFVLRTGRSSARSQRGHLVRQNIVLEPLDTPVLFAAPFIESIRGKFQTVQADSTDSAYLLYPSSTRIEYSVTSRSAALVPEDFGSDLLSYLDPFAKHFLQVPSQSDRIAGLAQDIAQAARSPYEKALAIQTYLTHNYRYSLDAPLSEQDYPLEEFLFARKTGYCEHYATAMVILLRTIGIPARLVTGFMSTEWNEYGNYYLVRQQDAHAWVEVYLPRSGWIMMDPTPSSVEDAATSFSAWHRVERMLDTVQLHWSRFFIQYSAADQLAVIQEMKTSGSVVRSETLDSLASIVNPLSALWGGLARYASDGAVWPLFKFIVVAVIGIGVLSWLLMKRPWWKGDRSKRTDSEDQITRVYMHMVRHLAKKGIARQSHTAPLELLRLTQERWREAGEAVVSITELYCRTRFGRLPLSDRELLQAKDLLRQLSFLEKRA